MPDAGKQQLLPSQALHDSKAALVPAGDFQMLISKTSRSLLGQPPSDVHSVRCMSCVLLKGERQVPAGTEIEHDMCMTGAQNKETTGSDGVHGRRTAAARPSGHTKLPVSPHKPCQPFMTSADPQRQSGVIASQAEQG